MGRLAVGVVTPVEAMDCVSAVAMSFMVLLPHADVIVVAGTTGLRAGRE
jgi:hypothetical protein